MSKKNPKNISASVRDKLSNFAKNNQRPFNEVLQYFAKDFFDLWLLSSRFDFEGTALTEAIQQTFKRRKTHFPNEVEAFSTRFIEKKQPQWVKFRNNLGQEYIPLSFEEVVKRIELFLNPVVSALSSQSKLLGTWDKSQWI